MTQSSGLATEDDALRMRLYELLDERVARERRWRFWRLAAGHLVVGVVLAYAFVFEQSRYVALTPILYGIVVMDGLKSSVRLLYLQQQLVGVEAKLREREPLFSWTTDYGFFGRKNHIERWDVDLQMIPETAQYLLIVSIYLGLIAASLMAWTPLENGAVAFGVGTTRELLVFGYGTFTVLFGVVVGIAYLHYQRAHRNIREVTARSDDRATRSRQTDLEDAT